MRPSYGNASGIKRGQSSAGSSMNGSQKENISTMSKYIGDRGKLGKTHEFDSLATNKTTTPLNHNLPKTNGMFPEFETKEEE